MNSCSSTQAKSLTPGCVEGYVSFWDDLEVRETVMARCVCSFLLLTLTGSFAFSASQATCKNDGTLWFVYCGETRASSTGYNESAACFKAGSEICPSPSVASSATCRKNDSGLWQIYCHDVQIGGGTGYMTAEDCFKFSRSICP